MDKCGFNSASHVGLRAESAVVVSESDLLVSGSVAAVNGSSVIQQQAHSHLSDQEHEVSSRCSQDIFSVGFEGSEI